MLSPAVLMIVLFAVGAIGCWQWARAQRASRLAEYWRRRALQADERVQSVRGDRSA